MRHFVVVLWAIFLTVVAAAATDNDYIVYLEWSGESGEHLETYTTPDIEDALDLIVSDFKENLAVSMQYNELVPYVQIEGVEQARRRGFAQASIVDIFDQMAKGQTRRPLSTPTKNNNKRNVLQEMRDRSDTVTRTFVEQQIFLKAQQSHVSQRSLMAYRGQVNRPSNNTVTSTASTPPTLKILIDRNVPFKVHSVPVWNLDRINQPALPLDSSWSLPPAYAAISPSTGLDLAWVYVVDVGILASHIELAGRVTVVHNEFPSQPLGCHIHATHVASTAAGVNVGVNPKARVLDVRVLDCDGSGTLATVLSGIMSINNHCTANGGRGHRSIVINMSIGGPGSPHSGDGLALGNELGLSRSACDAVIVAAAGNEHQPTCTSLPAAFVTPQQGRVMAASATAINDGFASFSNYGACTAINAPGVNILGASNAGTTLYDTLSGTSMASPIVAGVASVHSMLRPVNWNALHPGFLFADAIYQKMTITDAVPAVATAPSGTTHSLLQITSSPISIVPVTPPPASPPPPPSMGSHAHRTAISLLSIIIFVIATCL